MAEKNVFPFWNFVVRQSLIYGLAMIVVFTIFDLLDLSQTNFNWFSMLVPILILYFALQERKKTQDGFLSMQEGFVSSFSIGIFGSFISNTFAILYFNVLMPERKQNILNNARKQIEDKYPNMSESQVSEALSYSEYIFQPHIFFVFGLIMALIISSIISLILASILKKEKNPFE